MGLLNSGGDETMATGDSVGVVASLFGDSGIEIVTVSDDAATAVVLLGVVEGEEFWRHIQLCLEIDYIFAFRDRLKGFS